MHHVAARRGADRRHRRPVDAGQRLAARSWPAPAARRCCRRRPRRTPRRAATASIAMRMEDCRARSAAVGFMSLPMTSGAWRTVQAAPARLRRASSGASFASSPTSRKRARGMALGGDLQPVNHHAGRAIAAHGVHRQREGRGQRTRAHAAALRQTRTAPFSALPRPRRPRGRRSSRNGCRRGAGASVRRNSGTRRAPRAAAPHGCGACRGGRAMSFASEQPWVCTPVGMGCLANQRGLDGRLSRGGRRRKGEARGFAAKPTLPPAK